MPELWKKVETLKLTSISVASVCLHYNQAFKSINIMSSITGKFADIAVISKSDAEMLQDAADAITATEAWEYIRNFAGESFMFSQSPEISEIQAHMKMMEQHSGCSYGLVMRHMEMIAKEGWESYVAWRTSP